MAKNYEINGVIATFEAGEALNEGAFVEVNSSGKVVNATGTTGIGVAIESASSGDQVSVELAGSVHLVKVNGNSVNIAAGDYLKWDSTNKVFVKAATSGDVAVAVALDAATADGVYISAIVNTYKEIA